MRSLLQMEKLRSMPKKSGSLEILDASHVLPLSLSSSCQRKHVLRSSSEYLLGMGRNLAKKGLENVVDRVEIDA